MKRSPLVRRTPFVARNPLRAVSKRRARENRTRTAVLAPLRESHPYCARCGITGVGLDAHELLSRARGGSITDVSNIRLLCRKCHTDITENPAQAERDGWALTGLHGVHRAKFGP